MRQKYEDLELDVSTFDVEDIIVTSTPDDNEGPKQSDF